MSTDENDLIRTILETRAIEPDVFFRAYAEWSKEHSTGLAEYLVAGGYMSTQDLERIQSHFSSEKSGPGTTGRSDQDETEGVGEGSAVRGDATADVDPNRTEDVGFVFSTPSPPSPSQAETIVGSHDGMRAQQAAGGRYVRGDQVAGSGGHAIVYRAFDEKLNRVVAWKEIKQEHVNNKALQARLVREAMNMVALDHPGVVPVFWMDVNETNHNYYVMRFVEGRNLREAIEEFFTKDRDEDWTSPAQRLLVLRDLLSRFVSICNTMQHAHDRKILHRDLKPENIRIGPLGETLVMDWGLTKRMTLDDLDDSWNDQWGQATPTEGSVTDRDAQTVAGTILGSFGYISPEAACADAQRIGTGTDIWGLGCILFGILTGKAPYEGKPRVAFLNSAKKGEFIGAYLDASGMPPPLISIVRKALEADPSKRYRQASDLGKDVERWLADEPVTAHRDSLAVRAARFARHHRTPVLAAATLILTALPLLSIYNYWLSVEIANTNRLSRNLYDTVEEANDPLRQLMVTIARDLRAQHPGTEKIALDAYTAAVKIARGLVRNAPDPDRKHANRIALAKLLRDMGEFESKTTVYYLKADEAFKEAIDIYKEERAKPHPEGEPLTLWLADLYFIRAEARNQRGNWTGAHADYQLALDACNERKKEVQNEGNCDRLLHQIKYNLGAHLSRFEDHATALPLVVEARTFLDGPAKTDLRLVAEPVQANKIEGIVLLRMGKPLEAKACFERAIQQVREWKPDATDRDYLLSVNQVWLARALVALGQNDQAFKELDTARHWAEIEKQKPRAIESIRVDDLLGDCLCLRGSMLLKRKKDAAEIDQGCQNVREGLKYTAIERKRTGGDIPLDLMEIDVCEALSTELQKSGQAEESRTLAARVAELRVSLTKRREEYAKLKTEKVKK